jgi:TRAP transporter TAXI family solute receptor
VLDRLRAVGGPAAGGLALLLALVLAGCGSPHPVADPPSELVVAAGERSGVYYRYGAGLAEALHGVLPDSTVTAVPTSGSVDNIERLARGEAAVAFALADTAAEAVAGTGPFPRPVPLRALARLYTNSVHVVVPAGSPVERVGDLAGLRVSVGAPGSGTEVTAARMLAVAGVTGSAAPLISQLGVQESADALAAGRLDAFFWSGGLPTAGVQDLAGRRAVRLLPTDDLLAGMRRAYGEFFVEQTVPGTVYGTSEDVRTIGVPNLLLVRADLPADLAEAITARLFEAQPVLVTVHPEARHLDPRSAITTAPVALHAGAAAYYRSAKPGVGTG